MPHQLLERQDFSPSCPSGGDWYACGSGSMFVGCCTSDPCSKGCPDGNTRPGAFDPNYYGKFPDASCGRGSRFYTCSDGDTFWGCCKSNPCSAEPECPEGDLTGAYLDKPEQMTAYSPTGGPTSTKTSSTRSRTSTTLSSMTESVSTTSAAEASPTQSTVIVTVAPQPEKKPIAAIAGGAAGGGVGLALIIALLIYYILHARRSRKEHRTSVERRLSGPLTTIEKPDHSRSLPTDAPPMYTSPNPNTYPHSPSAYNAFTYSSRSQDPQEPPILVSPSPSIARKPLPIHRLSELSGETAQRSELESPLPSPQAQSGPQSPQSTRSYQPNWTAHTSWQRPQDQALGIFNEEGDEINVWRDRQEIRGYPGV